MSTTATGLVVLILASAPVRGEEPARSPDLSVQAWASTAGPYGEGWELLSMPDGATSLQVFYSLTPSGSLMARFSLSADVLGVIRATVEKEGFFDLPTEMSPKVSPLHQPDLRLDIRLGNRQRKVTLYDPGQLKDDPRAQRFLRVWRAVYQGLPLKPTW